MFRAIANTYRQICEALFDTVSPQRIHLLLASIASGCTSRRASVLRVTTSAVVIGGSIVVTVVVAPIGVGVYGNDKVCLETGRK